jgi:hypothetical protein
MPSNEMVATHMAANASLISNRSTSATVRPARANALGIALTGASPVWAGPTPTLAHDRTMARAGSPGPADGRRMAVAALSTVESMAGDRIEHAASVTTPRPTGWPRSAPWW